MTSFIKSDSGHKLYVGFNRVVSIARTTVLNFLVEQDDVVHSPDDFILVGL